MEMALVLGRPPLEEILDARKKKVGVCSWINFFNSITTHLNFLLCFPFLIISTCLQELLINDTTKTPDNWRVQR